ncbi:hypothetical protein M569_02375, partial [Genlisea aurea]
DAAVLCFCEFLEDICGRAEIISDEQELDLVPLSHADIKVLVNEIMSIRTKGILSMVPVGILSRILKVLDHQIHRAEGLSINDCENGDSDVVSSIYCSLESIHAALALMACDGMPKQLYKEENIERILEFSRHQIMELMFACDPTYRALHKPNFNEPVEGEEDDVGDFGSASKRRRTSKNVRVRKSTANRTSASVNAILQKMCTILDFVKQLLMTERLSDSCILQLVRTSLQTLLVDNIQLLQLKAVNLIGGIYYTYSQHRSYMMDETLQILLKFPLSKKVPRTYHLPDEEQRQIQLATALLMQMIHYSANLPEMLRQISGNSSFDVSIDADYPSKCYEAVTESCCLFWSQVLQRYTSSKNQDTSELKAIMENLVMDLLSTLNLPEYPASAPILEVLCVLLLQNAGPKSKDTAARTMAIDLLGTIAARLKHDAVLSREEKFWIVQGIMNNENDDARLNDACPICFDHLTGRPILVCQSCDQPFHVDCIGGREQEAPSSNFECLVCLCERQLCILKVNCESQIKEEQKSARKNLRKLSRDSSAVTKQEVIQQMLLNYLQDIGAADEYIFVRWFYLCLWYKDDVGSQEKFQYLVARLKARAVLRDSVFFSSSLSRDSVKKITLALGQNCSFARGYDKIFQVLLASLRENSPVIRSKAMRAVSIIVEADPGVLGDKLVQAAVEDRFCDSAISVREAALELVGRYIASHPDVGLKYFDKVVERIKDTGVSVRKRAIKIIREMCTSSKGFSQLTTACVEIISRINDEESSIQDLVCKTFYEFWFEESNCPESHVFEDGSCVPLEVSKKTEQMVDVLRSMSSHQSLTIVIRRNLALDFFPQSAKAAGINPVLLASVHRRCELMCKCLLEKVLQVSEMSSEDPEGSMLPYVLLLHAFCLVDPTLCAPASDPSQFVTTLQPYLKSQTDNRLAAKLLESILFIIDCVLPLLRKLSKNVVEELEQDLKQMIVRHSFLTVVHASIKCLCSVGKLSGKSAGVVEYLIQLFYKRLGVLGLDNKQVGRSLFCLGLLIRYGSSTSDTSAASSVRNEDVDNSIGLFRKYLQAEDFTVKVRALQALGFVFIAQPEFMLQKDVCEILEATLSANTDTRLKMQSLQNMLEYLLDAESRMQPEKAGEDEVNNSIDAAVAVAAGAGDTNICGGIIQLYWSSILQRSLDVNEHVRNAALKIMEIVLRQGLVHPISCVPHLIALETDPQEDNSKIAHHLLMNMNEKYPAFCESRLGDGLQLSFKFIHSISGGQTVNQNPKGLSRTVNNPKAGSSLFARQGVARIYKLIRSNRVSRNRFMSSVVLKYETPASGDSVASFLTYCTEILALLPFTTPDEPLYLIYAINRAVQVRAGTLESNMKEHLQSFQGTHEKRSIGNGAAHQFDQTGDEPTTTAESLPAQNSFGEKDAYGSNNNSISKNMNHRTIGSSPDLQTIQADCLGAGALILLLKLKRYLKIVYSLDDARCQAYAPNDPIKPGENSGLSRQSIPLNLSDVNVEPPATYEDLLRRYQDFKNVMKEDSVDYSTYTSNVKKKRPTPRKGSSKSSRGGGDEAYDDEDEDW